MTNFNYFYQTKTRKIRYLKHVQNNRAYIVFLHGFMSNLEGKKPSAFLNFAKKNKLGFLAIEYSGHGKSSGKFTNGNISIWTKETSLLIKKIVKKNPHTVAHRLSASSCASGTPSSAAPCPPCGRRWRNGVLLQVIFLILIEKKSRF